MSFIFFLFLQPFFFCFQSSDTNRSKLIILIQKIDLPTILIAFLSVHVCFKFLFFSILLCSFFITSIVKPIPKIRIVIMWRLLQCRIKKKKLGLWSKNCFTFLCYFFNTYKSVWVKLVYDCQVCAAWLWEWKVDTCYTSLCVKAIYYIKLYEWPVWYEDKEILKVNTKK